MYGFYLLVGKRFFAGEDQIWTLGTKVFWRAEGTARDIDPNTWGRQVYFCGDCSGLITCKMSV
jgi:hypothetical protein